MYGKGRQREYALAMKRSKHTKTDKMASKVSIALNYEKGKLETKVK